MIFTGSIELVAVTDATQITSNMVVNGSAAQVYDENGNCYPDWETDTGMRPTFRPVSYDPSVGNEALPYVNGMDKQKWYYNNAPITWTLKSGNLYVDDLTGCFELNLSDPDHPFVTIVKNLATIAASNGNDDNLAFEGYVMGDTTSIAIRVDRDIRISKLASGTSASIQILLTSDTFDGDDQTNDTIEASAYIIVEGSSGNGVPSGYTVAVSGEGFDETDQKLPAAYTGTPIIIPASMVGSKAILTFTLKNSGGVAVAWASEVLSDPADAVQPTIEAQVYDDSGSSMVMGRKVARDVKKGEKILLTSAAISRDGSTDRSGDFTATWGAIDGSATDITSALLSGTGTQATTSPFHATAKTDYDKLLAHGGVRVYCKWRSKG